MSRLSIINKNDFINKVEEMSKVNYHPEQNKETKNVKHDKIDIPGFPKEVDLNKKDMAKGKEMKYSFNTSMLKKGNKIIKNLNK